MTRATARWNWTPGEAIWEAPDAAPTPIRILGITKSHSLVSKIDEYPEKRSEPRKARNELHARTTDLAFWGPDVKIVPSELRQELWGVIPAAGTIPTVAIWPVNERLVRARYLPGFGDAGNFAAYPWIPEGEIWLAQALDPAEIMLVVVREYSEVILRTEGGLPHERAHALAAQVEHEFQTGRAPREFLERLR
jgi:hypothetical protein